jgi:hypothetical protein
MESALKEWWTLLPTRMRLLADAEREWLIKLAAAAKAYIALGDTGKAMNLTERLGQHAKRSQWPGWRLLDNSSAIRKLLLLTLRHQPNGLGSLAEFASECAAKASQELDSYKEALKAENLFACDRAFADYMGVTWDEEQQGLGMFSGWEAPSNRRLELAEVLLDYAELLLYAGLREKALQVTEEIETGVLDGFDEQRHGFLSYNRIAYSYPVAISSAIRMALSNDKSGLRDRALRHRNVDVEENGRGRAKYYERVFSYCRVEDAAIV